MQLFKHFKIQKDPFAPILEAFFTSLPRTTESVHNLLRSRCGYMTDPLKSSWTKSEMLAGVKSVISFVLIVLFLRGTVVEAFKIPSGSMIPTLRIGDHLLVSKLSYGLRLPFLTDSLFLWSSPRRGDIVVFTRPDEDTTLEDESGINLIKRVIGLPGDTVEVRNTTVFINNERLDESYAVWDEGGRREGNFGPERVPPGQVLLFGDNRDQSKDSRFWQDPFVDVHRVKGRALVIYYSNYSLSRIGNIIR